MQKLITYLLNNNIQFIITNKQIITYPTSSPTWEKITNWTPNTIDIDLPNDDVTITCIPLTDLPTS